MKNFWISWYDKLYGLWELHSPWWVSGERPDGALTICAAVKADDEEHAMKIILDAHDEPPREDLEWRFVEQRPDDWSPFNSRFIRSDWMKWS